MNVAAVILAAGGSTRMGEPKHLLRLPNGRTMPARAADEARAAGAVPLVVLGASADAVGAALGDTASVVNADWETGLGSSIACGVSRCADADAVLIVLADQIRITAEMMRQLIDAAAATGVSGVSAARYSGSVGVPACFGGAHFEALVNLPVAGGAKQLLARLPNVAAVEMPGAADDVDTPRDLSLLTEAVGVVGS